MVNYNGEQFTLKSTCRSMTRLIYTVGHSNRTLDEFLRILRKYGIVLVVDVRRWPTSRRVPWFRKENLEKVLAEQGIRYVWLGELLGGYRPGGYENYMKTAEYARGIEQLVQLVNSVQDGYPAVMCRERLWFRCHRRFIADTLTELGFEVIHIIDEDRTYRHRKRGGTRQLL